MLRDLFVKYGTDKQDNRYDVFYEEYLPKEVDDFLEIGVYQGAGILSFQEYYGAGNFYAMNHVYGVHGTASVDALERWGLRVLLCDQGDVECLNKISVQFDVIVDDGSHHSDDQIISFKHLFKNNLKKGGLYVIEDVHCCLQYFWWRKIKSFNDTILGVVQGVVDGNNYESQMFTKEESDYFIDNVSRIEIRKHSDWANPSIIFFWK